MIRLPEPREVPDRWPYLRAHVEGLDDGLSPLVLRMPRTNAVFSDYQDAYRSFTAAQEADDKAAVADAAEALAEAAANALADMWAHPVWELDEHTDRLDEFWEAGITESVAIRIVGEMIAQRMQRVITEQEVAARSSFFGARPGDSTS